MPPREHLSCYYTNGISHQQILFTLSRIILKKNLIRSMLMSPLILSSRYENIILPTEYLISSFRKKVSRTLSYTHIIFIFSNMQSIDQKRKPFHVQPSHRYSYLLDSLKCFTVNRIILCLGKVFIYIFSVISIYL